MTSTEHNQHSSYREVLLEHLFAGEVMRYLWCHGVIRVEVLKPQVDDSGYDLVLEANGIVRHVQLKASHHGATTSRATVNAALANKPSGCVIWIQFDKASLSLGPFLWFGSYPGEPLPSLSDYQIATHTKANAQGKKTERPNIRIIPKRDFKELACIAELVAELFGPLRPDEVNSEEVLPDAPLDSTATIIMGDT